MVRFLIACLFLLSLSFLRAQDSIPQFHKIILGTDYKDLAISENFIYGITTGDTLVKINIENETAEILQNRFSQIEVNVAGEFFAIDSKTLWQSHNGTDWKILKNFDNYNKHLYLGYLLLDKYGKPIVITNYFVLLENRIYRPSKKHDGYMIKIKHGKIILPEYAALVGDFLYMHTDLGEWGSHNLVFDTKNKKYLEPDLLNVRHRDDSISFEERKAIEDSLVLQIHPDKIKKVADTLWNKVPYNLYLTNIKGIATDLDGEILISQSLQHMSVTGDLIHLKFDSNNWFNLESLGHLLKRNEEDQFSIINKFIEEYLGPIAFNKYNNSFVLYSNEGFSSITKVENKFERQHLFNPQVGWKSGLPHSVGYQMAIKQMEFLDDKRFVFLTNLDGIGYFKGDSVVYFR